MIALPVLKGVPATLDYTDVGIGNGTLSRIGLWIDQIMKDQEIEIPGPWASHTDPDRIKTALVSWIERLLSRLESSVLGSPGCTLTLEKLGDVGEKNGIYLMIHYPYDVDVIFCDILPKIGESDKRLESVVIVAFQMLCWFKNAYTYDDCFEQYQDWGEEQLSDTGLEGDEREAIKNELDWIDHHISKAYRFLLRKKDRPLFPPFPECPPESSWTHPWWHWAREVYEKGLAWESPIPYFPHYDLLQDACLLDPGCLTPFLWSRYDPLTEYFSEMLDSEYQGGSEPFSILPFNNEAQVIEGVHLMLMSSEWSDLFLKGSRLPGPPKQTMEETPA
ncbi:MAG: hypothetical protein ACE5HN_10275 [Nitrospiria bacterium]